MKKLVFTAVLFAGCIFSTVFANAQTVKVGLERYFKNSPSISISDSFDKSFYWKWSKKCYWTW